MKFKVGDYVETNDGKVGYISHICYCDRCKERGFFEPTIKYTDGSEDYISNYSAPNIKNEYKRIGQYNFKKSAWGKWVKYPEYYYNSFDGRKVKIYLYCRTNGKKVQVRYGGYRTEASCYKEDKFDFDKGYELAKRRLIAKMIHTQVNTYALSL